MKTRKTGWMVAVIAAISCGCAGANAQTAYQVGSSSVVVPGTSDFTIDLGQVTTDTTVLIFDAGQVSGQDPTTSAGRVTVAGTVGLGSNPAVSIAVSSTMPAFANSAATVARGLVNLSTLTVTDPALRARTRAIISLSGNLTGDSTDPTGDHVSVGQVFRLDAAGTVSANVTAWAKDNEFAPNSQSIEFFRAASMAGKLEAKGGLDQSETSSIRSVRIFDQNGAGLTGDVVAKGRIGSVWSAGPIGLHGARSTISATRTIGEVRAVTEDGAVELARDFEVFGFAGDPTVLSFIDGNGGSLVKTLGDIGGELVGAKWVRVIAGGDVTANIHSMSIGEFLNFTSPVGGVTAGGTISGNLTTDPSHVPLTQPRRGYNCRGQGVSRWRGRSIPKSSRTPRSSR